jgi:eukaryotic-like serine/threonine-protein kinase
VRLVHAEALAACGERDAAREVLRAARARLDESATKIGDAALRDHFLRRVPDHARTLELADE